MRRDRKKSGVRETKVNRATQTQKEKEIKIEQKCKGIIDGNTIENYRLKDGGRETETEMRRYEERLRGGTDG